MKRFGSVVSAASLVMLMLLVLLAKAHPRQLGGRQP